MLNKTELDKNVAEELGLPLKRVKVITDAFVDELISAVIFHGGYHLIGLGKLRLKLEKGSTNVRLDDVREPMRIRLYFSKAPTLKEQIERRFGLTKEANMPKPTESTPEEMTKYAVDEGIDPDVLEKAATQGCPKCGGPVSRHGRILECRSCGTEPFEK